MILNGLKRAFKYDKVVYIKLPMLSCPAR